MRKSPNDNLYISVQYDRPGGKYPNYGRLNTPLSRKFRFPADNSKQLIQILDGNCTVLRKSPNDNLYISVQYDRPSGKYLNYDRLKWPFFIEPSLDGSGKNKKNPAFSYWT